MVKNPLANAGDMGIFRDLGRSHMPWSNEAHVPQLRSLRATTIEATATRSPHTATEGRSTPHGKETKAQVSVKTQHSQKINKYLYKKGALEITLVSTYMLNTAKSISASPPHDRSYPLKITSLW